MRSPLGNVASLSLGRVAVGVVSIARPDLAGRVLGVEPSGQTTVLLRLFGAREIAVGLITLTSSGPGRRTALVAGIAVDGADAATALLARRDGDLPSMQASALAGTAAGAVGLGLSGLLSTWRAAHRAKKAAKAEQKALAAAA